MYNNPSDQTVNAEDYKSNPPISKRSYNTYEMIELNISDDASAIFIGLEGKINAAQFSKLFRFYFSTFSKFPQKS